MRLTPTHAIILLVVVVLLFGASRLPALADSLAQSLKIFKRGVKDLHEDDAPAGTTTTTTVTTPVTTTTADSVPTGGVPLGTAPPSAGDPAARPAHEGSAGPQV